MANFTHLRYFAASDQGRKRKNNEDAFGAFPEAGIFCVADGMGGGDDGEVASAATVRAIETFINAHPLPNDATFSRRSYLNGIETYIGNASAWIFRRAQEKSLKGCGSTFAGVCFDAAKPDEAIALHAGDSRVYRLRGRSIQQITKDHSAAELIGAKDEAELNPMFRGMILRAVGILPTVEVERTVFGVREGDRILLCSDGLTKMLSDREISAIVRENPSVEDAVGGLIAAANNAGGLDNVTAVIVDVGPLPPPAITVDMPIAVDEAATMQSTMTDTEPMTSESHGERTMGTFDFGAGEETVTSSTTRRTMETVSKSTTENQPALAIPEEDSALAETRNDPAPPAPQPPAPAPDPAPVPEKQNRQGGAKVKLFVGCCVAAVLIVVAIGLVARARENARLREEIEIRLRAEAEEAARLKAEEEARRKAEEEAEAKRRAEEEAARMKAAEEERLRRELEEAERLRMEKEAAEKERFARMVEEERVRAEQARLRAEAEMEARRMAEEAEARRRAEEEAVRVAEAKRRAEVEEAEAKRRAEEEAARMKAAEEEAKRLRLEEEARRIAEETAVAALREVCNPNVAPHFAKAVSNTVGMECGKVDFYKRLHPLADGQDRNEWAVERTKTIQGVAKALVDHAKFQVGEADDELRILVVGAGLDSKTRVEALKRRSESMHEFIDCAGEFIGGDPEDPNIQCQAAVVVRKTIEVFGDSANGGH